MSMELQSATSLFISLIALFLSAVTTWMTLIRKGTVRMTQPTVIYFGADGGERSLPKVFLRTLLYSTSKRGHVIENLFVRLRRGETQQNFTVWVYGDAKLARGSGLFVGEEGVAVNHHFLLPQDGASFEFKTGEYLLEVLARRVGKNKPICLFSTRLEITSNDAEEVKKKEAGAYFDWGPESGKYHIHVEGKPISTPKIEVPPIFILPLLQDEVGKAAATPTEPT